MENFFSDFVVAFFLKIFQVINAVCIDIQNGTAEKILA